MPWVIDPTVTINGVSFKDKSLWNVQISYGRESIWEQARAAYATIDIVNLNNTNFDLDMNHSVVVTVDNSSGTPVTLFTGKISNVSNSVVGAGSVAQVVVQTVTAVSVFADMARKVIGNSAWAKEYDDARLTRIFTDAGVTISTVDTPPVYEFTARSADPSDAYSLAANYAQQAFGYIYETRTGSVGYANESRRFVQQRDYGYLTIPTNYILWQSLQSQKTLADIMNNLILSYKANAQKTASDATSIATYGNVYGNVVTELETGTDAQTQADRYVTLRAYPRTSLSSFSIQLDNGSVSDANRDALLNISMDTAIQILNLPIGIKNTTYRGFVEGWTFNFNQNQFNLTFNTSDASYSVTPTRWQDVSATLIWNNVGATVTWNTYD